MPTRKRQSLTVSPDAALTTWTEFFTPAITHRLVQVGATFNLRLDPQSKTPFYVEAAVTITAETAQAALTTLQWVRDRRTGEQHSVHALTGPVITARKRAYDDARAVRDAIERPFKQLDTLLRAGLSRYESTRAQQAREASRTLVLPMPQTLILPDGGELELDPETAPQTRVADVPDPVGSFRDAWRAEVTDLKALVLAVAAGRVSLALLTLNQAEADAAAALYRDDLATHVPGLTAVNTRSPIVR